MAEPKRGKMRPATAGRAPNADDFAVAYGDFLRRCRPVPEKVMRLLARTGLDRDAVSQFGIRYYFHGYRLAIREMCEQFGMRVMIGSGLLQVDSTAEEIERARRTGERLKTSGSFEAYREKSVPYLVIPFRKNGQLVHVKARSLYDARRMHKLKLPTSLATHKPAPCWFNYDAAREASYVLLLRDELDAIACSMKEMTALAYGRLSAFKRDWIEILKDKHSVFVLDKANEGDQRVEYVLKLFEVVSETKPEVLIAPAGASGGAMVSFLQESLSVLRTGDRLEIEDEIDPSQLPGFDELLSENPMDDSVVNESLIDIGEEFDADRTD